MNIYLVGNRDWGNDKEWSDKPTYKITCQADYDDMIDTLKQSSTTCKGSLVVNADLIIDTDDTIDFDSDISFSGNLTLIKGTVKFGTTWFERIIDALVGWFKL